MSTNSLFFIDSGLMDAQTLIAGLPGGAEWMLLDAAGDGVLQMQRALAGRTGLDAIHVLSHGRAGALNLGSTVLDAGNLADYASALQAIGTALSPTGDLLLYGCEVGAGAVGAAFIDRLASLTGADVAVSNDVTGSAALGGDWRLEVSSGSIEAPSVQVADYAGTLLGSTVNFAQGGRVITDFAASAKQPRFQ